MYIYMCILNFIFTVSTGRKSVHDEWKGCGRKQSQDPPGSLDVKQRMRHDLQAWNRNRDLRNIK